MYPLADRFVRFLTRLPRRALTQLPTPVQNAPTLASELGLARVSIKRDDVAAPDYGGNKVRKLEFLLADAQLRGCDTVITFGAAGSNHALATSLYARKLGLDCIAIVTDQPKTPYVETTLRWHGLLGTRLLPAERYTEAQTVCAATIASHPTGADRIYEIPWGGSSWLGSVGFVNAALELVAQLGNDMPDVIYTACGTMGTAVGLGIGLQLAGVETQIEAVQVVPNVVTNREQLAALFNAVVAGLTELEPELPAIESPWSNLSFREGFIGDGYAERTADGLAAVELMHQAENHQLETTYTGKALAALMADARSGELAGKHVMFWNTYNSRKPPAELNAISANSLPETLRRYLE